MAIARPDPIDTHLSASISFAAPDPPITPSEGHSEGPLRDVEIGSGRSLPGEPNRTGRVVQGFPIQQAKVQRPPLRAATLHRHRLVQWLDEHINRRVIFVTAEAGYGKTTLLADWARRTRIRVLWYRIDEDDANWVSFVHYLIAAGRELDPAFALRTHELLAAQPGEVSRDAVVGTLIGELPTLIASGPALFILDDYHLVDPVPEIRALMKLVITRAPSKLTFALVGRRTPSVSVSRLRAMGEVAELGSRDLRFQLEETEQLFRDTYGRDIEADVLEDVARRTEGWAASLQLVEAALRDRSPSDTRTFIRGLTGAKGDLYDYLAEEVVADLDSDVQTFLMRTSILQVIDSEAAALVTGFSDDKVERMIAATERLGLLARRGQHAPEGHRYHPLVREFLEARLAAEEGSESVVALHQRLAAAFEDTNWRSAAYHHAAIAATGELHRLLIANASSIMATGEFDVARGFVEQLGLEMVEPVFDLFLSRVELDRGNLEVALRRATSAYDRLNAAGSPIRFLALANAASLNMSMGNLGAAYNQSALLAESQADPELVRIGNATVAMLDISRGGSVLEYQQLLEPMAKDQRENRRWHYLAITLLNSSVIDQTTGDAISALKSANEAVELLADGSTIHELTAARSSRAWALAHLGMWQRASDEMASTIAAATGIARQEALVEAADIWTWYGDAAEAEITVEAARNAYPMASSLGELLEITRAELLTRQGRLIEAEAAVAAHSAPHYSMESAHEARILSLGARLMVLKNDSRAGEAVSDALEYCRRQGSFFYASILEILRGAVQGPQFFDNAVSTALKRDAAYLSIVAEVIVARLDQLSTASFDRIVDETERRPLRWRDPLRAAVTGAGPAVPRAAALLERIGSTEDVPLLRALARRARGKGIGHHAGRTLARRTAPHVFLEDQGRVRLRVGETLLPDDDVRRRVLAILCFLITRPGFAATRDEVVEALWSDADPTSGVNSLNQTLYFLRRVLEPNYVEDLSANYVHHDSDVVWLDQELVDSRSRWCQRVLEGLADAWSDEEALALSKEYRGKFALDFAYEEWAANYRETLHAAYLGCVERAISRRIIAGEPGHAIALARRALQIDPEAEQLERLLLRAYHDAGSRAAVGEQYAHYAAFLRNELGIEPPELGKLVTEDLDHQ